MFYVHSSSTDSDDDHSSLLLQLVSGCDPLDLTTILMSSAPGMCLVFLAWTVVSAEFERTGDVKKTGYPQVVFVWLYAVFYSIAWSGLLVSYALEILPYRLRAKGMMIMNLTVQAALVLGKYVFPGQSPFSTKLTCLPSYTNPIAWEDLPHHWNLSLIYTVSILNPVRRMAVLVICVSQKLIYHHSLVDLDLCRAYLCLLLLC